VIQRVEEFNRVEVMGTDWVRRVIVGTDIAQYTLVRGSSFNGTSKRCYPIGRTTWRTRCIRVFIRTPWHTIQVGTEIQASTYSMRIHHLPEMQHLRNINLVQSPHQAKGTAPPHPEEFLPCGSLHRERSPPSRRHGESPAGQSPYQAP